MGMFLRRGPAPSLGTPIGDLDVGSVVKLNVDGTPWEFLVVHQGLPSSMYDASCDGTWLLMKNLYEKRAWNGSVNNRYAASSINTYLNGDFLAKFDSNIQSAVKQVKIPYCVGGGSSTVNSGANGLETKVFLLGGYEVGFTTSNSSSFPVDGAKLAYFEAGTGTSAKNKRIANYSGSATGWWLRSPQTSSGANVWLADNDGTYGGAYPNWTNFCIRPAFILPSDFALTDDMLA